MRTYEYRMYPNQAQSHLLMQCLIESRHIYNEMLETIKAQYEEKGTFPGKYDLTSQFKGRGGQQVPATTVQTLADRLTKALKRFLAAKELGQKVGFPIGVKLRKDEFSKQVTKSDCCEKIERKICLLSCLTGVNR